MTVSENHLGPWRRTIAPDLRESIRAMRTSSAATRMATGEIRAMAESRWMFDRTSPISCATTPGPYYGRVLSYPRPR